MVTPDYDYMGLTQIVYGDDASPTKASNFVFTMPKMSVGVSANMGDSGKEIVSYTWKFDVMGYIVGDSASGLRSKLQDAYAKLNTPGKTFTVITGIGTSVLYSFGPKGSNATGVSSGTGDGEALNGGPFPKVTNIPESAIIGEITAQINWSMEVTVRNQNYNSPIYVSESNGNAIIDVDWKTDFDIDLSGATKRTVSGLLKTQYDICADQYRVNLLTLFPKLKGFARTYNFGVSQKSTELAFTITDQEEHTLLPPGAITLDGSYRVAAVFDKRAKVSRSLTGTVTGPIGPNVKKALLDIIMRLIIDRFGGIFYLQLKNQEVVESITKNEIQFNISTEEDTDKSKLYSFASVELANKGKQPETVAARIGKSLFDKPLSENANSRAIAPTIRGVADMSACLPKKGGGTASNGSTPDTLGSDGEEEKFDPTGSETIFGDGTGTISTATRLETFIVTDDINKIVLSPKGQNNAIVKKTSKTKVFFAQVGVSKDIGKQPEFPIPLFPSGELMEKNELRGFENPDVFVANWNYVYLLTDTEVDKARNFPAELENEEDVV